MTIYFLAYGIFLLSHSIYSNLKEPEFYIKNKRKHLCVIFFIVLVAILGLRHPSMGYDLQYGQAYGYLGRYEYISTIPLGNIFNFLTIQNYEFGFIIYCKLLSIISDDPQFFIFVSAAISVAPIIYVIYKKNFDPLLSLFVYIGLPSFLITYSGIRQGIAIGICFLTLLCIEEKKLTKFILLTLLAATLHKSSLVFLIAYPLYHLKIKKSNRYITILLIPLTYALRYPLFSLFSRLFKPDAVAEETGAFTLMLVFALICIFCIIFMHDNTVHNGYTNLLLFACICQVFGSVYNTAMRVAYYFMLSLIILLPSIISNMRLYNNRRISRLAIMTCFAVYGLYSIYSSTWAMAAPYKFFWWNA